MNKKFKSLITKLQNKFNKDFNFPKNYIYSKK